ncbi:MAG: HAMP domain-containing histidine kinase [Negativicutes bacterium]|nr:HAMP domain-containing histidine kinase [Negativicutes bacterium]
MARKELTHLTVGRFLLGLGLLSVILTVYSYIDYHDSPGYYSLFNQEGHLSAFFWDIFRLLLGLAIIWVWHRFRRRTRSLARALSTMSSGQEYQSLRPLLIGDIDDVADEVDRLEATLAHHRREQQRFFACVAHELRNPLAVLIGNLENMIDGVTGVSQDKLISLLDGANRINRLIDDLRSLSLLNTGTLPLASEPVDLQALLDQTVAYIRDYAGQRRVSLDITVSRPVRPVMGDAFRLRSIISNLILNAVKYSPSPGTVQIITDLWQESGRPFNVIHFIDNGPGIPLSAQSQLFDYFYRTGSQPSREGSGLGLALSQALARAHGGQITVDSQTGQGSRFTLLLPAAGKG